MQGRQRCVIDRQRRRDGAIAALCHDTQPLAGLERRQAQDEGVPRGGGELAEHGRGQIAEVVDRVGQGVVRLALHRRGRRHAGEHELPVAHRGAHQRAAGQAEHQGPRLRSDDEEERRIVGAGLSGASSPPPAPTANASRLRRAELVVGAQLVGRGRRVLDHRPEGREDATLRHEVGAGEAVGAAGRTRRLHRERRGGERADARDRRPAATR